jgi:hypothetical protein
MPADFFNRIGQERLFTLSAVGNDRNDRVCHLVERAMPPLLGRGSGGARTANSRPG